MEGLKLFTIKDLKNAKGAMFFSDMKDCVCNAAIENAFGLSVEAQKIRNLISRIRDCRTREQVYLIMLENKED